VRFLGEIPAPASTALRAGTLRRCDQEALDGVLGELEGRRTVLVTGDRRRKRSLAIGLAAAAAASGTRTALLECDLAEPTLAEALPGCASTSVARPRPDAS
jgi:Mrp family chromosome partitioning ATPase